MKLKNRMKKATLAMWLGSMMVLGVASMCAPTTACTGITIRASDGAIVYGRTLEWSAFDMHSRLMVVPRGMSYVGETPDGKPGYKWTSQYGFAGIDGLNKGIILDGMNEHGLALGLFYHPGFAVYEEYKPDLASETIGPAQVTTLLLGTCQSIDDVKATLGKIRVVPVLLKELGFPPPVHLMVTEPTGKQIVIEFTEGKVKIYDAPLGVITNAPNYDWHLTNLRNYVNLSNVGLPDRKLEEIDFSPLGGGSGMIGLPGDFTPPSRFIRAVAFSATARKVASGDEAMYELFRILDNFNVPLTDAEGSQTTNPKTGGLRSATLWTICNDTKDRVIYYHTQNNRRVRSFDLKSVDFNTLKDVQAIPLDQVREEDIQKLSLPFKK